MSCNIPRNLKKKEVYMLQQQDIDAISDKNVENKVCLGANHYEFNNGPLKVRENTTLIIPIGTTLKITD
jgi:hypothetical protein